MQTHEFVGTREALTLADLAVLEATHDFTLPTDYKAHLLAHNGGWIRGGAMFLQPATAEEEAIERDISNFNAVKYGKNTVESSLEDLSGDIHPDLVPFGDETGGDIFVLSVGPQDYGAVYYIAHEFYTPPEEEYDEETDESTPLAPLDYGAGVHFLASSFTEFLDGLITSS
ncbi:MAG: SMI1/KNR4 family protein [Hymenobacter sp.]|nr:MAG: SMI1/KNR4 family protein [Hymenobacter sp.]